MFEPLTGYVPSAESPPPAPKHVIASSNRAKKVIPGVEALRSVRRPASIETESETASAMKADGTEGSMSSPPSVVSSSSRTPSPIAHGDALDLNDGSGLNGALLGFRQGGGNAGYDINPAAQYADIILNYFISETTTIPTLLITPPADFDPNMSIDDDEHTALHWACAMGRIRVVKLLLTAGADVFRVNLNGQTALMRAAMFSNNYDLRKFPELFELLHRSILNIDRTDRTVFHHVVDLALSRGKPHAARYYMETMINRLQEYGSQLADILNFQDDEGETPLTMAARARSKRLTKLLLEHGADPKVRNKEGKNAEDYIVEDERFRASPVRSMGLDTNMSSNLRTSEAGQRAGGRAVNLMTTLLHSLAESYDAELESSERKLSSAHSLLAQIQSEIADSTKILEGLDKEGNSREEEKKKLEDIQRALRAGAQKRTREEMLNDWTQTEQSIKKARTANGLAAGQLASEGTHIPNELIARLLAAPSSPEEEEATLKEQVASLKAKRSELLTKFIESAKEQGTGKMMASYRRLIAAGCGGIAQEEVDNVVSALCELLEDPTSQQNGTATASVMA